MAFLRSDGYWYQSRREGNRVISEYIGSGPFAADLAALSNLTAEMRRHERWEEQRAIDADREIDRQIDEINGLIRMLTAVELMAKGYHTHKGQWRRRRNHAGSS